MPTIEERLARYGAQLDDAALARVPAATTAGGGARRGPGRRVLVAALGVAVALAIAVGIAVANHDGRHASGIAPASTPTTFVATTPPTRSSVSSTTPTTASATSTTSTTTSAVPVGTSVVAYHPFVGNAIDPRLHVTTQASGYCLQAGVGAHDYYRCFDASGSQVYDPCFEGPRGSAQPLVCPNDPTALDVVAFLASSVSGGPANKTPRPWAFQLEGGQVCLFLSAAWGRLGPYSCSASAAPPHLADCHEPTTSQPWWSASCQAQLTDTSPFVTQRIVTVWD
ncbi:MAG TPA: hypothetical protein VH914_07620 [Acidimicrobiia bacterium]|nr:hypothetical protein [Acidimicrobiia bacterium]